MSNNENSDKINIKSFTIDVLIFSFGQLFLLFFTFILSIILARYLTTEDYGYWQFFLLCNVYVGIFHLGFLDGILVRWAGKELNDIKYKIPSAFRFLVLELFCLVSISLIFFIFGNFPHKEIVILLLLNSIISNILLFFLYISQAIKKFKLVSIASISQSLLFLFLISSLLTFCSLNYLIVIISYMIAEIIIIIFFLLKMRDILFPSHFRISIDILKFGKENIEIGIFVLMGNFIALLFITLDRWVVSSLFTINQFAVYAFAVSMSALGYVFLQAISQVFLPYLSELNNNIRTKTYHVFKPMLIIFWSGILLAYFPLYAGIRYFLPKYIDSLPLIVLLLCSVGFSAQIQIIHANYFKVYGKQRVYFILAAISLICLIFLYIFAIYISGTLEAIAFVGIIGFGIWYILNELYLQRLLLINDWDIIKSLLIIGSFVTVFICINNFTDIWIHALAYYLIAFTLIIAISLHLETRAMFNLIKIVINRK
jgi:O-antigen/teichoic acid export membrane protein